MLDPNDFVGVSFWLLSAAMVAATFFFWVERDRAEGKWTQWDENGQIMEERYYKMGELQDWKITTIRQLSD